MCNPGNNTFGFLGEYDMLADAVFRFQSVSIVKQPPTGLCFQGLFHLMLENTSEMMLPHFDMVARDSLAFRTMTIMFPRTTLA